jgi:hypothetical protein
LRRLCDAVDAVRTGCETKTSATSGGEHSVNLRSRFVSEALQSPTLTQSIHFCQTPSRGSCLCNFVLYKGTE